MLAVVVGDLRKSELVIKDLEDEGYAVAFLDIDKYKEITDACLRQNRIQFAKLFIALTEEDQNNLYLCKLAKKVYNVPKTIALANYQDNIDYMAKQKIDGIICTNLFIRNSVNTFISGEEDEKE